MPYMPEFNVRFRKIANIMLYRVTYTRVDIRRIIYACMTYVHAMYVCVLRTTILISENKTETTVTNAMFL